MLNEQVPEWGVDDIGHGHVDCKPANGWLRDSKLERLKTPWPRLTWPRYTACWPISGTSRSHTQPASHAGYPAATRQLGWMGICAGRKSAVWASTCTNFVKKNPEVLAKDKMHNSFVRDWLQPNGNCRGTTGSGCQCQSRSISCRDLALKTPSQRLITSQRSRRRSGEHRPGT